VEAVYREHRGRDLRRLRLCAMVCEPDAARTADGLRELVRSLEAMRKGEMFPDTMTDALRENFGDHVVTRAADQIATDIGAACSSPVSSTPGRTACCCRPPLRSRRRPSTRQCRRRDLTPPWRKI
jgi:hypothetical protein